MKNINFNFVRILLIINFLLIFFQYNKEYTVRKQLFLYTFANYLQHKTKITT